jgi:hypothetical protein
MKLLRVFMIGLILVSCEEDCKKEFDVFKKITRQYSVTSRSTEVSENFVITDSTLNEGYTKVASDLTIGNPCGEGMYIALVYKGDLSLKGDIDIAHASLIVDGNVERNTHEIVTSCDTSELLIMGELLGDDEIDEGWTYISRVTLPCDTESDDEYRYIETK